MVQWPRPAGTSGPRRGNYKPSRAVSREEAGSVGSCRREEVKGTRSSGRKRRPGPGRGAATPAAFWTMEEVLWSSSCG